MKLVLPDNIIERIAQACHEANRAYCSIIGEAIQPTWEQADMATRVSSCAGVEAYCDNPLITPEQSHDNWMAFKRADGWVYGIAKCPVNKTHPCMKPYSELSHEQRCKDAIFLATAKMLADRIAYDIQMYKESKK